MQARSELDPLAPFRLDGRVAVVSSHRLRPEAYGLPENEDLVFKRLEIETVHELGHTFGLLHCFEPTCVMHASTYVEEIDLKSPEFCTDCLRALAEVREEEHTFLAQQTTRNACSVFALS